MFLSCRDLKAVAKGRESFCYIICAYYGSLRTIHGDLFSKHMVVGQTSFNKDSFHFNVQEQHVSINPKQETTLYCDEICGNQDTICHKEGVSVNLDENSADIRNHSLEIKPENAFSCAEVKDSRAETRVPDPKSYHQTQNKVYTTKQACSTRKYIAPLSESMVCRNSGVDYAPNKSAMTGSSPVSKSCRSSDGKPCNRDICGNTPMLEGQSYGLPEEKTTTNSNLKSVTSFCDKNLSIQMEVQGSLDVNHYRDAELTSDLKGIINLVGGYFHPSPILSV
ncbi:hypothetical protein V6N11_073424 [Hibiscus sabdariffa]|uniref:Uncharacterized protein n=1 Tax=Hibiscus sabdariffa TaxID=183260 RepID=A0ABR2P4U8_9ROSI